MLREFSQSHRALQREPWADKKSARILPLNAQPTSTVEPKKTATALAIAGAFRVQELIREQDSPFIDLSPAGKKAEVVGNKSVSFWQTEAPTSRSRRLVVGQICTSRSMACNSGRQYAKGVSVSSRIIYSPFGETVQLRATGFLFSTLQSSLGRFT